MPETPAQSTKNRLFRIYGVGILLFIAAFGSLTLLAYFLAYVK
jgi:hypothetical protein